MQNSSVGKVLLSPRLQRKNDFLFLLTSTLEIFFGCGMSPAASRLHCGDFFDVNTGLLGLHESVDSVFLFQYSTICSSREGLGTFQQFTACAKCYRDIILIWCGSDLNQILL